MEEKEFYKKIGKALRTERKKQKLTIFDIAARIGVGKSSIANWEMGITQISVFMLDRYCNALNYSLCELLEDASVLQSPSQQADEKHLMQVSDELVNKYWSADDKIKAIVELVLNMEKD